MRGRFHWGTLALWVVTIFGFVYLFTPLITIAASSFNQPEGRFNTSWNTFTSDNWANAFQSSDYTDAFVVSLRVAFVACTIATILGVLIAWRWPATACWAARCSPSCWCCR